jgi:hypothetical protein
VSRYDTNQQRGNAVLELDEDTGHQTTVDGNETQGLTDGWWLEESVDTEDEGE